MVVDDEPVARMLHVSMLGRMPGVSAVGVGSVAEAHAFLAGPAPGLVILDVQLPDGSGLNVLLALAAARIKAHLVIVTGHLDGVAGGPGASRVLSKPVSWRELQQLVEKSCAAPPERFAPVDYVQLACMGLHTAVIECEAADGRGEIAIENGVLWSARDEGGEGPEALSRLLALRGCDSRVRFGSLQPGARNLPPL